MERIPGTNQVLLSDTEQFEADDPREGHIIFPGPCTLTVDDMGKDTLRVQGPTISYAIFIAGPLESHVKPK